MRTVKKEENCFSPKTCKRYQIEDDSICFLIGQLAVNEDRPSDFNHLTTSFSNLLDARTIINTRRSNGGSSTMLPNLVVSNGIKKVMITRVQAGMHHGSSDTEHGSTSILKLDVELAVTLISIFNLSGEGVSSGNSSG